MVLGCVGGGGLSGLRGRVEWFRVCVGEWGLFGLRGRLKRLGDMGV